MAEFKKGNTAGKGGRREGAGRKPDVLKAAITAALDTPRAGEKESLVEKAIEKLHEALTATDEDGNPAPACMDAVKLVLVYKWGRPPQPVNMDGEVTVRIEEVARASGTHRRDS